MGGSEERGTEEGVQIYPRMVHQGGAPVRIGVQQYNPPQRQQQQRQQIPRRPVENRIKKWRPWMIIGLLQVAMILLMFVWFDGKLDLLADKMQAKPPHDEGKQLLYEAQNNLALILQRIEMMAGIASNVQQQHMQVIQRLEEKLSQNQGNTIQEPLQGEEAVSEKKEGDVLDVKQNETTPVAEENRPASYEKLGEDLGQKATVVKPINIQADLREIEHLIEELTSPLKAEQIVTEQLESNIQPPHSQPAKPPTQHRVTEKAAKRSCDNYKEKKGDKKTKQGRKHVERKKGGKGHHHGKKSQSTKDKLQRAQPWQHRREGKR